MFGGKKSTDECYKTNEHSNVATFVLALVCVCACVCCACVCVVRVCVHASV